MKQHKLSIIYIAPGQKISAFICGLPLPIAVVLPGCLPQKEVEQNPNLQSPISIQVKET